MRTSKLPMFVAGWLLLVLGQVLQAQEPVLLAYKFKAGDRVLFRSSIDQKQVQTFLDQKHEMAVTIETFGSRTVDSVNDQGLATIKHRAERIKVKTKILGLEDYEFDSKSTVRDKASEAGGALTPVFDRLTGADIDLFLTPRGEVQEVKAYGELLADAVKDSILAIQLTKGGSNESARVNIQEALLMLSDKPVKPGDEWEGALETELPRIGKMKGKMKCKYLGPDKVGELATAKISVTPEAVLDVNVEIGGIKVTGALSTTTSDGTAQFDPAAGRLVSFKTNLTIAGQLTLDGTVPFKSEQSQTTTYDLVEKLPE